MWSFSHHYPAPPPLPKTGPTFTLGLDLGGPGDTTTLAVVETTVPDDAAPKVHAVRHVERFVGTSYADIAERIHGIRSRDGFREAYLVIGATAAGEPVVKRFEELDGPSYSVTFTAGERTEAGARLRLPLKDAAGLAHLLLEDSRLRIAEALHLAPELARELRRYTPKLNGAAPTAAAWREGTSDDLVLSVLLALWKAETIAPSYVRLIPIRNLARRMV
jgi:hypothetical protein